jgi:hypothetical protein
VSAPDDRPRRVHDVTSVDRDPEDILIVGSPPPGFQDNSVAIRVTDPELAESMAALAGMRVTLEDDAPPVVRPRPTRQRATGVGRHRSEADIQKACVVLFKHLGGYMIVTTGSRYLPTGTPDSLGCMRGRFVVIEYKRPGQKPTEAQLGQLRRWQLAGALAAWVCSEQQLEHVLTHLDDPNWVNDFSRPGDGRPDR